VFYAIYWLIGSFEVVRWFCDFCEKEYYEIKHVLID